MPISRRSMLYGSAAAAAALPGIAQAQRSHARGSTANAYPAPPAKGAIAQDTEWHATSGDNRANRYSPLDQITGDNFKNLTVAWRFDAARLGPRAEANWEGTPLLVKGRLYITAGSRRDIICLDAITGELLWMHTEDEGKRGQNAPRSISGRGCAYWTDGKIERIVYVTPGYRLLSLDIATGIPDPRFGKNGVVDLMLDDDQLLDPEHSDIGWQGVPMVVGNVVVIGAAHDSATSPRSVQNAKGYVRGYDLHTGKRLWIFHTIPKKGEFGYDTWLEDGAGEKTGNTGSWGSMCADEELGLVYVGIELPTGDYVGIYRKGPALFGESLVALDVKTGKRKWHYQMVHHGLWDNDVPCQAMIVDIPVNGKMVKAIAQPTKQAFLYVLNRETGEPVWPIPEMPVPAGNVPGEWYSPTQPMPSRPPAFDRQSVTDDDLVDFTPAIKARARQIADHYVHGQMYTPPTLATLDGKWGSLTLSGLSGGANWPGAAFDPETKIVYVYSKTVPWINGIVPTGYPAGGFAYGGGLPRDPNAPAGGRRGGGGDDAENAGPGPAPSTDLTGPIRVGTFTVAGLPIVKPPYGRITALDLKDGTMAWQVAHGETPDNIRNHPLLKGLNIPRTGQAGVAGALVTKTLVICGDPQNTTDAQGKSTSWLRAYDKATGKELASLPMVQGQTGSPMTYAMGAWQYIVLCIAPSPPDRGSEMVAYRLHQI